MIERSFNMSYLRNPLPEAPRRTDSSVPAERHDEAASDQVETIYESIRQALIGLQFGEINITIRNGSVVQIERVARKRQFKSQQRNSSGG